MLTFKEHGIVAGIKEQKTKRSVVFCFGRFQPVTTGHAKMINRVIKEGKDRNADVFVFASHSQDNEKNPLTYKDKIGFISEIFPEIRLVDSNLPNPFFVMKMLSEAGYKSATIVCGSDRVKNFQGFEKYIGHENELNRFDMNEINVVDVGPREGTISATILREHALSGQYEKFTEGLAECSDELAKEIYNKVRSGMEADK